MLRLVIDSKSFSSSGEIWESSTCPQPLMFFDGTRVWLKHGFHGASAEYLDSGCEQVGSLGF